MDDHDGRALVPAGVPASFERRMITIAAGSTLAYAAADWRDALVVVDRGAIELEGVGPSRLVLRAGAVLWLAGLSLRALHNHGPEPAVLVAVARRDAAATSGAGRISEPRAPATARRPPPRAG